MDSVTQAVLGASIQGALLGRWQGRKALLYGAALATLPDLDILIDYGDPVANMTHHRSFSHSLLVLTGASLLMTGLITKLKPQLPYSPWRLWLTLWLVLITHPLLDTMTTYGTQLLWPFEPPPAAVSSIFIIDPLYTLPLLMGVLVAACSSTSPRSADKPPKALIVGLVLSSVYLAWSYGAQQWMTHRVMAQARTNHVSADKILVVPAPFTTLLWRVVILDDQGQFTEGLVGVLDHTPPQWVTLPLGQPPEPELAQLSDYQRMQWFTQGFLRQDRAGDEWIVTDLRLGMTGLHPFRFGLATERDGHWQPMTPAHRLPRAQPDWDRIRLLWHRIWSDQTPVPLAAWAKGIR